MSPFSVSSTRFRVLVLLAVLMSLSAVAPRYAQAQNASEVVPARLSIFLDCQRCPDDFIRQEVPYVDHVRDREVADVHVLVTREETGGGGEVHTFELYGLRLFEGVDFSTSYTILANATEAEQREGYLRTLEAALVPYLMKTNMRDRVSVHVAAASEGSGTPEPMTEDPWDFWTFTLYSDGNAEFESQQRSFFARYGVYVSRVTEDWKLQLRPFFNYNYDRFERGERIITSTSHRNGFTAYALKSITPHWSLGGYADILKSSFSNVDLRYRGMGAIEWSLYPYREANRRQLTVAYRLGGSQVTWADTTIYGKTEEVLPQHLVNADYQVVQPWGNVEVGIIASQYLHETSRYSLEFDAEFEVRVTQGLSVEIGGSLEIIHDQINLAKGDADLEEVLLRRRQLETNYEAGFEFGIRYRFGSVLNNIVNPRFDGIGNRDRF